jgi:hypothetical protein
MIRMVDTAETIRQRIAHYRTLLAQGVPADIARMYLEQIAKDHAALRELSEARRSDEPSAPRHRSR